MRGNHGPTPGTPVLGVANDGDKVRYQNDAGHYGPVWTVRPQPGGDYLLVREMSPQNDIGVRRDVSDLRQPWWEFA